MLPLALFSAGRKITDKMQAIAGNALKVPAERVDYAAGVFTDREDPEKTVSWDQVCFYAYRRDTLLSPGMEPGLMASAVAKHPRGFVPPTPGRQGRREGSPHIRSRCTCRWWRWTPKPWKSSWWTITWSTTAARPSIR